MSLVSIVEKLQNKPLSADEAKALNEFQRTFNIDDDDPLMVVLAMMARSQILVESVPSLLQQKTKEIIELHSTVLREQAVVISKELIADVATKIKEETAKEDRKKKWLDHFGFFVGGFVFAAGVYFLSRFWH